MRQFLPLLLVPLVFLFGLFVFIKTAGPIPFSVSSVTTSKQDAFTVTGEGKFSVKPDVALISLGVSANGASVKTVQEKLNSSINAVSAAVKNLGVSADDIKTVNYSINPTYDYSNGAQHITGYSANSTLSVKVRDLDKASAVIDAGTAAGANQVGGISFDVDDRTNAESQARKLAVTDAKKKAQAAADIAGFKLGRIVNYSEGFGGQPRPMTMALKADSAVGSTPTQVEPGTSEINVTVSLSYEIL